MDKSWRMRERTRTRVPRAANLVPGTSPVPLGIRNVPMDTTYLEIFEDEKAVLDNPPSRQELQDLLADPRFRYYMIRMAIEHNRAADRLLTCELSEVPDIRGAVKGIRSALGLPGMLLDEARISEAGEGEGEPTPGHAMDHDDFGPSPGVAPDKAKE